MAYLNNVNDFNDENRMFVLKNHFENISFETFNKESGINVTEQDRYYNRYFLRKGFSDVIMNLDESIVKPQYVDQNGQKCHPNSKKEAISLIYDDKIGIKGFEYAPDATNDQKEAEYAKIIDSFVNTSNNLDFADEKYTFCINNDGHEVLYNHTKDEEMKPIDVRKKLGLSPQKDYSAYIAHKKDEIRKRLANRTDEDKIAGSVVADKIAQARMSGVLDEPVTPEQGNKMAISIKKALLKNQATRK